MKRELEALLFATDSPLTIPRLKALFPGISAKELRDALKKLMSEYEDQGRAFTLVEFGGGWQIASRPEFAPLIEKMFRGRRFVRLTKAGLEVLAIISYRQPITRIEIEDVRGVQCSGVLSTLTERNLITIVGRAETVGHPLLYGTTRELLNHLGLRALNQLPQLPDVENLINDREGLREFAAQIGEQLTEDDIVRMQPDEAEDSEEPSEVVTTSGDSLSPHDGEELRAEE